MLEQKHNEEQNADAANGRPAYCKTDVSGSHGYFQSGNRYFWRIGAKTKFNQGFKSKANCDNWINEKRDNYGLDWRVGFMVKFKKFDEPWVLVDRKGNEVKYG